VAQKKEKSPKQRDGQLVMVVRIPAILMVFELLIATKEMEVHLIYTKEERVKENERII
jgi:hypothetical protein